MKSELEKYIIDLSLKSSNFKDNQQNNKKKIEQIIPSIGTPSIGSPNANFKFRANKIKPQ